MLDTNVLYQHELVKRARDRGVDLVISRIVHAEFLGQLLRGRDARAAHELVDGRCKELGITVLDFDAEAATEFAKIKAGIPAHRWRNPDERMRRLDRLIAAAALSVGRALVTDNVKDFGQCETVIVTCEYFAKLLARSS